MKMVVIGGVAAGMSAAARARRLDGSCDITVLEKGDTVSYSACGFPYFIDGRVRSLDNLVAYTPDEFRRERNIDVRTSAEVVSISHARREVFLAGGEHVRYDRLVIATGARPDAKSITGATLPHVFHLVSLGSTRALGEFLKSRNPRSAVIVGGSYIGIEAAEALRSRGLAVTLVEKKPYLLSRNNLRLTGILKAHLEKFRIDVRLETAVSGITPSAAGEFPCDLVVLATGLKPNVELAADAGIELGRTGAIRVSERMETNLGGVFSAGDCAEAYHVVTGAPVWSPLGTTANKMGRVAGANAVGKRERFGGIAGTAIVRACGLGVAVTGLSPVEAKREGLAAVDCWIHSRDRASYFQGRPTSVQLVADRNTHRLLGGAVVGEGGVEGRIGIIAAAIQARLKVEEFQELDLAYAPPFAPVWDPVLIAAQQLLKALP